MQLRKYFPSSKEGAALYGGFMYDKWHFCRVFKVKSSIEQTIKEISDFVEKHGYQPFGMKDLDDEYYYERDDDWVHVWPNPTQEDEIVLVVERDIQSNEVIDLLIKKLEQFRDERDWNQFHDSKNLAIAISIEAAELNELFLWKSVEESEKVDKEKIKEELADVLAYSLLLAAKHDFDIESIVLEKINKNEDKYPIEKAKGNAKKYNEL